MNTNSNMPGSLVSLMLIVGLSFVSQAQAAKSGERYLPAENVMLELSAARQNARENDKLLLVIMGANWCHDSRALASRIYKKPLSKLIAEHYETIFIDVGYLEKGKDVINSLGLPVYYATPTVLIVDPVSGQLLNRKNRHQWANAANISMQDSVEYFQQMSKTGPAETNEISESLQLLLAEVDAFEQLQADRLYEAYAMLGPMLRAYKEGDKEAFSKARWNEVREFRYEVPADLDTLRAEAYQRSSAGETNIKLNYPRYPAFSWE